MRFMKLARRTVNFALFIWPNFAFSLTVQAQECSTLISQGIYDISSHASDLQTASSFASWFCDQKFSSSDSSDNFGASLAFPFKGVPVKFGFDSGSQSFPSWYSSFCSKVQQDQSLQSKVRDYVQTVNATIVNAFNDCINADGLSVWLERTYDPHVLTLQRDSHPLIPPKFHMPGSTLLIRETTSVVTVDQESFHERPSERVAREPMTLRLPWS
jgi:hypothetical protein